MQWSSILLLTAYTYPFFATSANLNVCQSLDRLNRTAQRVSPLVDRLAELHDRHACVGIFPSELDAGSMDGGVRVSDREDVPAVIQAVHDMLRKLEGRIEVRKKGCVDVLPESLGVRRWIGDEMEVEVEVEDGDGDEDSDDEDDEDDDGICELDDVVEALVDTLEFLLSFVGV